jgi:hypothetical protein
MTLLELLSYANAGYPDGYLATYYDTQTGTPLFRRNGDTLAAFIVYELAETYDKDASDEDQVREAERVLMNAQRDLENVINSIHRRGH